MQPRNARMMNGRTTEFFVLIFFVGFFLCVQTASAATDSDGDGLSDELESIYGTQFFVADTDADGFTDFEEIKNGFSPLIAGEKALDAVDTDKDKLLDWQEYLFGTNKNNVDTDGDGFTDYDEVMGGYIPTEIVTSTRTVRKIIVDRTKQQLHYVVNDIRITTMPVSTGNPSTPTPNGEFTIQRLVPVIRYTGVDYDFKGVKWNMQFKQHYYFHTAYWHNDFGKRTRSHGCVNMREADAGILYKYVSVGMPVSIIGETPKRLYVAKK